MGLVSLVILAITGLCLIFSMLGGFLKGGKRAILRLIIVIAVLVCIFLFREQITAIVFKASYDNKTIEEYLLTEKIKFSKIVKEQDEINKKEITYINGASNEDDFNDIRRFLKKNNLNKNICMVDVSNHSACINTKSFIIKPTIELKSSNISSYVNNTKGGSIIKIDKNLTLNEFKVYLSKLKYNNLEIVDLIDLIKE